MGIITCIRPPAPVAEQAVTAPVPAGPTRETSQTADPVGQPILAQAVQQTTAPAGPGAPQLLAVRTTAETSAAAAAEAARAAYIKASIAAGINPLPVP
ncbi:hypothetical protein [Rhodobacter calidifons]|uniref:Uncharacterized protein n=1 Tax=Rhodobacter calidifons TaxID=2715277 RepID=A0ABX0G7A4_9RHOB|nr:hypothetical protein [Rhodobacter calidifons]NHB77177.1 hypothetical protein [Rhodobacter calidifons]